MNTQDKDNLVFLVLHSLRTKPLQADALESAGSRVFSKLVKIKTTSNMKQPSFFEKIFAYKAFKFAAIALVVVGILSSGTIFFLQKQEELRIAESLKVNYTKLADTRLKELTGLSANDYRVIAVKAPELLAPSQTPKVYPNEINDEKLKEVLAKLESKKSYGYYNKVKYQVLNTDENIPDMIMPVNGSDAKEFEMESVSAFPFESKNIIKAGGKIVQYNLSTDKYSIDYRGGSYAVKEIHQSLMTDNIPELDFNTDYDQEIGFLKNVIFAKNVKRLGLVKRENKEYYGFELISSMGATDNVEDYTAKRYYTDIYVEPEDFQMAKMVLRTDTKELAMVDMIESVRLDKDDIATYMNTDELKGIPIKEFKLEDYDVRSDTNLKISEAIKQTDLYYVDIADATLGLAYNPSNINIELSLAEKAKQSIDFNPNYLKEKAALNSVMIPVAPEMHYAQGSDNAVYFMYDVYKDDPRNTPAVSVINDYEVIEKKELQLNIAGRETTVYFQVTKPKAISDTEQVMSSEEKKWQDEYVKFTRDYQIVFKAANGLWYSATMVVNTNEPDAKAANKVFNPDKINIIKVDSRQAKEFDLHKLMP